MSAETSPPAGLTVDVGFLVDVWDSDEHPLHGYVYDLTKIQGEGVRSVWECTCKWTHASRIAKLTSAQDAQKEMLILHTDLRCDYIMYPLYIVDARCAPPPPLTAPPASPRRAPPPLPLTLRPLVEPLTPL